jgi:hypothetical protein
MRELKLYICAQPLFIVVKRDRNGQKSQEDWHHVGYSSLRILGKGTYVLDPALAQKLCDFGQDSFLPKSWFSPLQNKDINSLPRTTQ